MSKRNSNLEEKSFTPDLGRFEGQDEVSVLQGILNRGINNRSFGGDGAGGMREEKNVSTRTSISGISDVAVDLSDDAFFTNLADISMSEKRKGIVKAQGLAISELGQIVIENSKSLLGIEDRIIDSVDILNNIQFDQNTLVNLGQTMLGFMGETRTASELGKDAIAELGNILIDRMKTQDGIVKSLGEEMSNFIGRSDAAQVDNTRTMIGFMEEFKRTAAATVRDMIQPGSALTAAADMLGVIQEDDETKHSGIEETVFEDFISELLASGVSAEDAKEAAVAIDQDNSKTISTKELNTYDASNPVVSRAINDPRFRSRLVKRKPFSSIYGEDPSKQFNQTSFVDNSFALDGESLNANNVAFTE